MSKESVAIGDFRRRTKIIGTLGPTTARARVIEKLIDAGMNIVRINCSHGDHAAHAEAIKNVRSVAKKLGVYIPVFLDLAGPKMRIGRFARGSARLKAGDPFVLTTRDVEGTFEEVSINYAPLVSDVDSGDRILMGDGEIELRVVSRTETDVVCEVAIGGVLKSNKGVNAPGVRLSESVPTAKDIDDIEFGIQQGVDWFALSFVRSEEEVKRMKAVLRDRGQQTPVIVKIEKKEALDRMTEILEVADAIMIARGDLGLDVPLHEVPHIQKELISQTIAAGKPVITATQMLESMVDNPRPTRAEAGDVANAVFDGTDAVMLSAETASGKYPVAAVKMMADVALASENQIDYAARFESKKDVRSKFSIAEAIARGACLIAIETGANVIVCCSRSGQTALQISVNRPAAKIAVVSPSAETLCKTMLYWNTHPVAIAIESNTDDMIASAKKAVVASGIASPGDRVVIVAGIPVNVPGTTNIIKADTL